jgi:hypothetical protein
MIKLDRLLITFVFLLVSSLLGNVKAGYINIVNPIRISAYNPDPVASIKAQYTEVIKLGLPATWLVTFDVLDKPEMISELKKFNNDQEIGLFLEITANFAKKVGVDYHKTGSWHFANAVLLSGYTQEERIKLIDFVFEKYKLKLGNYPVSVGSWWTDSFSLSYMKEKYGVVADLGCSDQFSTDNYSLWGQPWSVPYYPSKLHTGIPAVFKDSLGVLRLQWAPRDPKYGYFDSLYSTQDYFTKPAKDFGYFKYLLSLYPNQVTIGLEGDLSPEVYKGIYKQQLEMIKDSNLIALTIKDYAKIHPDNLPKIQSDNAVWYQTSNYRIGMIDEKIIDLRRYLDIKEPYYERPNRENTLYINIPAVFDYMNDKNNYWDIGEARIKYDDTYFEIDFPKTKIPLSLLQSPYFRVSETVSGYKIEINDYKLKDYVFSDWSIETLHNFRSKRFWVRLLKGVGWDQFQKTKYLVSAEELLALNYLGAKASGKVLVYNNECLQCEYHSQYKPAVFANLRDYIGKYSNKKIIYDTSVFEELDRKKAKMILKNLDASYIYLAKYESYIEKLPFSPGDLGVEKIFENANTVIWEVVK